MVSNVSQCSVLGPLLFILYTADFGNDLENKIVYYTDDTTLYSEVASSFDCINVANSLNRDLVRFQLWYLTWGMKLNLCKTHSITI